MRDCFRHFFRPPDADLTELWQSGLFSLDASVLLNVYGYSFDTSEKLLSLLEILKGRIWLPHQFGLEFARNRGSVVIKQISNYADTVKAFRQIKDQYLAPKHDHPFERDAKLPSLSRFCICELRHDD